ncbi:PAS domain-containing protein [Oxalobacteraceae bacterium]|nr:PAS domain-containing protein [Oxalobacteraceae bacterium]
MRKNLPVTNIEYEMADGKPIVSKTDLKGKITYINPYFVEVSGFTEAELIGAPHNLVRHPDMPPEAFADLWQTLKAGLPWTGLVKNRRKNGDHYWVVANVTPVIENGRATGYMSVRSKPERAQIEAAERVYRDIVAGNAKRIALRQGQVVRTGLAGKGRAWKELAIQTRFNIGLTLISGLMAAMGAIAFLSLSGSAAAWSTGLASAGIVVALVLALALRSTVTLPLRRAIEAARALACGDLTGSVDVSWGDDMGQLLRALQQINVNMMAIIGDVRANVDAMGAATRDIAQGNLHLSNRTEAQASSLEETASSMEELSSTVRQNADSARQASELVASTSEIAVKGGQSVAEVRDTMGEISASANKIVDIIALIDGIAFQTNILALNAAVEAARAGEQGRGFAVVASEVRNLAQRSAAAAKDIKGLIDDSVSKVELGNRLVGSAGQTMSEIIQSVQRVAHIMGEIAAASREQSSGIEQVNRAVTDMDEGTQQNAALVEQAAAAAASLDEQTVQLSRTVSVFHVRQQLPGVAQGGVLALAQRQPGRAPKAGPRPRAHAGSAGGGAAGRKPL